MTALHIQSPNTKRLARILLALFVLVWLNLIVQSPLHAAMKLSMQLEGDVPCHCDDSLCDTVLAMQDQADNGASGVALALPPVSSLSRLLPVEINSSLVMQHLQLADIIYHNTSPPPLLRTGILLI